MIFIGLYTGHQTIDSLIESSSTTLFYGVAGSGKTTMLMTIAGNYCRNRVCLYVSTEETLHYERVARDPERYRGVLFTEIYDFGRLVDLATFIYLHGFEAVFIDSLNSLFRLEPLGENSLSRLAYIVASLRKTVENNSGKLFASAQVRAGEGEDKPVGEPVLDYYFDVVVSLSIGGDGRYARIVKPPEADEGRVFPFRITESGVEWM